MQCVWDSTCRLENVSALAQLCHSVVVAARCAVGTRAPRELADAVAAACVPVSSRRCCRQDLADGRRALCLQGDDCAHPAGSPSHCPASWRAGASLRPCLHRQLLAHDPRCGSELVELTPTLSVCPSPPQVDMHHERVYMIMELCQAQSEGGWARSEGGGRGVRGGGRGVRGGWARGASGAHGRRRVWVGAQPRSREEVSTVVRVSGRAASSSTGLPNAVGCQKTRRGATSCTLSRRSTIATKTTCTTETSSRKIFSSTGRCAPHTTQADNPPQNAKLHLTPPTPVPQTPLPPTPNTQPTNHPTIEIFWP